MVTINFTDGVQAMQPIQAESAAEATREADRLERLGYMGIEIVGALKAPAKRAQEYKGFNIKKGRDCWGSISFFAYRDGWQHFDAADTLNDLKELIDESRGE